MNGRILLFCGVARMTRLRCRCSRRVVVVIILRVQVHMRIGCHIGQVLRCVVLCCGTGCLFDEMISGLVGGIVGTWILRIRGC